jgi:ABC-2 type transport system permease protein
MHSSNKVRPALIELSSVRIKEFIREPEAIFWVFMFPVLLTVALGLAFREKPPDRIPVGIVSGAGASEQVKALAHSPALMPRLFNEREGRDALRRGKISLLVEESAPPVFRFDPTRPDARTARLEVDSALQTAAGRHDVIAARDELVREQGSRYIDFLVPGLIGMNLMGTGMWGIGFTVVNARMKKLLKRLVATPMRKSDYLFAQFISRIFFLTTEVTVVAAFGWLVFGVKIHGSILLFACICLLGGFAFSGIGLLTASRVRTIEGVNGLMNLIMMPMWLCSGVFFSYERFPEAVKPLIRALPLTALNDALRGVMNDSLPASQAWPYVAILAAWAVVTYTVGLKIFRWQ